MRSPGLAANSSRPLSARSWKPLGAEMPRGAQHAHAVLEGERERGALDQLPERGAWVHAGGDDDARRSLPPLLSSTPVTAPASKRNPRHLGFGAHFHAVLARRALERVGETGGTAHHRLARGAFQ